MGPGKAPVATPLGRPGTSDAANRRRVAMIAVALVAVFLAGVVVTIVLTAGDDTASSSAAPTSLAPARAQQATDSDGGTGGGPSATIPLGPSRTIDPVRVAAPLQSAASENACGSTTTFDPEHLLDHDGTTAWRTDGSGVGRQITLNLGGTTRVTRVGLVNGYAKIDPCDGTDRYFQNRRVTQVRWTFDDGTSVTQGLDPADRSTQTMAVDAETVRVQIEILATTPPGDRDFTPISDIEIEGVAP